MNIDEYIFGVMLDVGEPVSPYYLSTCYNRRGKYECNDPEADEISFDQFPDALTKVVEAMARLDFDGLITRHGGHTWKTKIDDL